MQAQRASKRISADFMRLWRVRVSAKFIASLIGSLYPSSKTSLTR